MKKFVGAAQPALAADPSARVCTVLPEEQGLLQPQQLRLAVEPVARLGSVSRGQEPDLIVVVQRPHRDARHARQLTDGVTLHTHLQGPLYTMT